MDDYTWFFGFSMFVIGAIVGRITMAIQYEVMKTMTRNKAAKKEEKHIAPAKPSKKLEYAGTEGSSSRREFYSYMKDRMH